MRTYAPSEIAAMTGLSIPTLHYYEQIGLLDPVERLANGHRRYQERDILRIEFLKRVRATGMSIAEMQAYVELYRQGDETLTARREVLEAHRERVLAQIAELQDTIAFLDMKIDRYLKQEQQTELEA